MLKVETEIHLDLITTQVIIIHIGIQVMVVRMEHKPLGVTFGHTMMVMTQKNIQ